MNNPTAKALELLHLTKTICHYESELERESGANFNLLHILSVGHLEVKTHSPILAELLNPNGSHGQGACFLRIFVDQLGLEGFDPMAALVHLEYHSGPKTDESGGRIDILIKDRSGGCVVIENKIYAQEQENQILRYENTFPNAHILYLTLDGSPPTSTGETVPEKLQCISYATHIISWLEACRKEAATIPIVRESISQYIHLLKDLTHQNTNSRMSEKIIDAAIQDEDSLDAYFALLNAEQDLKDRILIKLFADLEVLAKQHSLVFIRPEGGLGGTYSSFSFRETKWPENVFICFEFQTSGYRNLVSGIIDGGKSSDEIRVRLQEQLPGNRQSKVWPVWNYWNEHRDWGPETFRAIQFGDFVGDLERELLRIKSGCDEVFKKLNYPVE